MPWINRLMNAVLFGSYDEVESLLNSGHSPDGPGDLYLTPLHVAISNNDLKVTKLLIDRGANIELRNHEEFTPIYTCLEDKVSVDLLELLLSARARIDVSDVFGRTPLHVAAKFARFEKLKLIAQSNEIIIDKVDYFGNTSLHYVLKNVKLKESDLINVVEIFTNADADINIQDLYGHTVLHLVVAHTHCLSILPHLLRSSVIVSWALKCKDGQNFLHYLFNVSRDAGVVFDLLMKNTNISFCDLKMMLNDQDNTGSTAFFAYLNRPDYQPDIVQSMLSMGADVAIPNNLGITPLMRACSIKNEGGIKLVEMMLENWTNLHACNISGSPTDSRKASIQMAMKNSSSSLCILSESSQGLSADLEQSLSLTLIQDSEPKSNMSIVDYFYKKGNNYKQKCKDYRRDSEDMIGLKLPEECKCCNTKTFEHISFKHFHDEKVFVQTVQCSISIFIENIAKMIGIADDRFEIRTQQLSSTPSTMEDIRKFEFAFCLSKFSDICEVAGRNSTRDMFCLRSKEYPPPSQFAYFFCEKRLLLPSVVQNIFSRLFRIVLTDRKTWSFQRISCIDNVTQLMSEGKDEASISFRIVWNSKNHKNIYITITVVPVIKDEELLLFTLQADAVERMLVNRYIKNNGVMFQIPKMGEKYFSILYSTWDLFDE